MAERCLVVGSEMLSRVVDNYDRDRFMVMEQVPLYLKKMIVTQVSYLLRQLLTPMTRPIFFLMELLIIKSKSKRQSSLKCMDAKFIILH